MTGNIAGGVPDDVMIRLDRVSKHYPGQSAPAVAELSLDVHAGEILVLLGPSGCGKTTTLRLINRLIEPSSGRIYLDGEDVTTVDADQLRRRIGYVIQQVGLFPHMTIAENIALIPRTLRWDKQRVRVRVDELLDLVGLEPALFRGRYPKQLSGGQQQRVGVARALAADPPAMLMDEPFGALDPITRERLQDEFLKLQAQIRKTIVLVTHDVTEAVKLGDRIAVLSEQARLIQCAPPGTILGAPANEFVASFIGSGAAIRGLRLERIASMAVEPIEVVRGNTVPGSGTGSGRCVVVDDDGEVSHWLYGGGGGGQPMESRPIAIVQTDQTAYEAVDAMLRAHSDRVLVVDALRNPVGALSWSSILQHFGAGVGPTPTGAESVPHARRPA